MLNARQKQFCEEYLINGMNATKAYQKVYNNPNKNTTYVYELLRKPDVKDYIQSRRQEIFEAMNVDVMRVMQEIADLAFEPTSAENKNIKLKALELLSKNLNIQTTKTENKDVIEISIVEDDDE